MSTPSTPAPRRNRYGCAIAAAVAALAFVALVAWGWITVDNWLHPPAPDVHKIATSADVVTADQSATSELNSTLAEVRGAVPWISDAGRSADDVCATDDNITSFGQQPKWAPVGCTRTVAWFGAFDGDLPQQLARINRSLGQAGWTPEGTSMDQLFQMAQAPAASATPAPGARRLAYAYGDYASGSQVLHVEVTELPSAPFGNTPQVAPASGSAEQAVDGPETFHREHRVVPLAELTRQADHGNRYVIGIELGSSYYTAPDSTAATPSAGR